MFDTVCCRLSDLPDKKVVHGYADFEFLKDHPYLRVDDKVYDIDYEYAVAKLESGALWRVAMSMPTKRRLSYFGFWGDVFEEYVNWIFESYADKSTNAHYPCPRYLNDKDDKAICDVLIMCGSTAVLIEAKAATCAASVRYSGDYKLVREYMDKRFVEGTDRSVGVSQLLTAIDNIGTMPKENLPEWLRGVKKIIPVIIEGRHRLKLDDECLSQRPLSGKAEPPQIQEAQDHATGQHECGVAGACGCCDAGDGFQ